MKVVLSIDPIKFPLTGIGRYTYELAKGLQSANLDSLQFLRGRHLVSQLPTFHSEDPMRKAPYWKQLVQKNKLVVEAYRLVNPLLKSRALRSVSDHLYHSPNYYLPPFAGKSVVTIHDLSTFVHPETHPPERVRFMQAEMVLTLKRASAIITDTEYTRYEVANYFNWPLEKIFAVPLASAAEFYPRDHEQVTPCIQKFGLDYDGYSLFTSTIEPRKNLSVLLEAYEMLPRKLRERYPLVIAGFRGWCSEAIHERLKKAERQGWLKYLGFVSDQDLPLLMSGARLFAYPSLYEGFGLPVLEAMSSGIPVVCSNASTLPEVAGDAAAFHDPADVQQLCNLLERGLEDTNWQTQARAAGYLQAKKFSWKKCAQSTLDVYRSI